MNECLRLGKGGDLTTHAAPRMNAEVLRWRRRIEVRPDPRHSTLDR